MRPLEGEKPGRLLKGLIHGAFGSVDARLERATAEGALERANGNSRVFKRFYDLCDAIGRGTVRLSDFLTACASVGCGALWTPTRLDGVIDRVTATVRWKSMSKDEIRSLFAFLVTRADDVTGEYDVDYDTFASEVEPRTRRDEEMKEAYALCDELIRCGAAAAQILEILNNPNIEAFSDETDWVGGGRVGGDARYSRRERARRRDGVRFRQGSAAHFGRNQGVQTESTS